MGVINYRQMRGRGIVVTQRGTDYGNSEGREDITIMLIENSAR